MRPDDLRSGVARVVGPSDRAFGTAFFVRPRLLVTCSHVLRNMGFEGPLDDVLVRLQVLHPKRKNISARVAEWRESDEEDIAFLDLVGPAIPGVHALPLGPSGGASFHEFATFGFPAHKNVEGMGGGGKIGVKGTRNGRETRLLYLSNQVRWGYSGGPVFEPDTARIVGVAVTVIEPASSDQEVNTAFMIPAETLRLIRPDLSVMPQCPFPADRSFDEDDRALLGGRDTVIDEVVEATAGPSLVVLEGPSGSGVTSILCAGVLPRLREQRGMLVLRLDLRVRGARAASSESRLLGIVQRWAERNPGRRLVLFVDHLDELFEEKRCSLLRSQIESLIDRASQVTLLGGARRGRAPRLRELAARLGASSASARLLQVGNVKQSEFEAAIAKPARAVGLVLDPPELAEIVANQVFPRFDLGDARGAPPQALMVAGIIGRLMWEQATDGVLRQLDDVDREIGLWAEAALYKAFDRRKRRDGAKAEDTDPVQARAEAEKVLDELIDVGAGRPLAARRSRDDVRRALSTQSGEATDIDALIDSLVAVRLIVDDGDFLAFVDTSETFIRRWPRLRRRAESRKELAEKQRELEEARQREALEIADRKKKLEEARLRAEASDARARSRSLVVAGLSVFLVAAIFALGFIGQQNQEIKHQKRGVELLARLNAARADLESGNVAWAAKELAAADEADLATLPAERVAEWKTLALEVLQRPPAELLEHREAVVAVAMDRRGAWTATLDASGRVWMWGQGEAVPSLLDTEERVEEIHFHPTEPVLLTRSRGAEGEVRTWAREQVELSGEVGQRSPSSPAHLVKWRDTRHVVAGGPIRAARFDPSGAHLLVHLHEGGLWSGAVSAITIKEKLFGGALVKSFDVSETGVLGLLGDKTIVFQPWIGQRTCPIIYPKGGEACTDERRKCEDARQRQQGPEARQQCEERLAECERISSKLEFESVTFGGDRNSIFAVASDGSKAHVYWLRGAADLCGRTWSAPAAVATMDSVSGFAVEPGGAGAFVFGSGGLVEIHTGKSPYSLPVTSAAWSNEGGKRKVVFVGKDRSVWQLGQFIRQLSPRPALDTSAPDPLRRSSNAEAAVSADGKWVAVAANELVVRRWKSGVAGTIAERDEVTKEEGLTYVSFARAGSPSGKDVLAIASNDGSIHAWAIEAKRGAGVRRVELFHRIAAKGAPPEAASRVDLIAATWQFIATHHPDGTVRTWSLDGGELARFPGTSMAVCPDGRSLALTRAGSPDLVFVTPEGRETARWLGLPDVGLDRLAISADGRSLLALERRRGIGFLQALSKGPEPSAARFTVQLDPLTDSVRLGPDASTIAAVVQHADGTQRAVLWELASGSRAPAKVVRGLGDSASSVGVDPGGDFVAVTHSQPSAVEIAWLHAASSRDLVLDSDDDCVPGAVDVLEGRSLVAVGCEAGGLRIFPLDWPSLRDRLSRIPIEFAGSHPAALESSGGAP